MALLFESWVLELVTLLAAALGALYYYMNSNFDYWKKRGVPFLQPSRIFGNIKDVYFLKTSFGEALANIYRDLEGHRFGGYFQTRQPVIMIRDPELIKLVLVKDFTHFQDHDIEINEDADPLNGRGLLSLRGHKWRNLRVQLTPTFTSGKMKKMFHLILECGDEMKKYLEMPAKSGDILDIKDIMSKYTTNAIGTCAFGIECNSFKDPNSTFRNMGKRIFNPTIMEIFKMLILFSLPKLARSLKLSITPKEVERFFISLVKDTVEYREKNNVVRNDFMQLLMELKKNGCIAADENDDDVSADKGGLEEQRGLREFSDLDITAQAHLFFIGGYETSATTMNFLLYELALNPDIQKKLFEEIDSVLEKNNGKVTYDAIQQMGYMDKVFMETLRKYPPATLLSRRCTKAYTIPGTDFTIDQDTTVVVSMYGIHFDPKYYPDPDKFDPERFNEENKKMRPNYTYLPFGEGPRICIGNRFAQLQTKVGLVSLLADYEFRVCKKTTIPLVMNPKMFILAPKPNICLQIVNRHDKK